MNVQDIRNQNDYQELSPQTLILLYQTYILNGDVRALESLLRAGYPVNVLLPNGEITLHFAVRENQPEIVDLLMKYGAVAEVRDSQNLNAIDHAMLMNNKEMVARILGYKAGQSLEETLQQIEQPNAHKETILVYKELIELVRVDPTKMLPIGILAHKGEFGTNEPQAIKEVINDIDDNGCTALHYAILAGRYSTVKQMIEEFGADIHAASKDGKENTLLHTAVLSKSPDLVRLLISKGLNPNITNARGDTPLHFAAAPCNLGMVETLVKLGADPHITNKSNLSPLALIGHDAVERDPLKTSRTSLILCGFTMLYWFTKAASSSDLFNNSTKDMFGYAAGGAEVVETLALVALAFMKEKNLPTALTALIGGAQILNMASALLYRDFFKQYGLYLLLPAVMQTTANAFDSVRSCWRNWRYRSTWDIVSNLAFNAINVGRIAQRICQYKPEINHVTIKMGPDCSITDERIKELANQNLKERLGADDLAYRICYPHALAVLDPSSLLVEGAMPGNGIIVEANDVKVATSLFNQRIQPVAIAQNAYNFACQSLNPSKAVLNVTNAIGAWIDPTIVQGVKDCGTTLKNYYDTLKVGFTLPECV